MIFAKLTPSNLECFMFIFNKDVLGKDMQELQEMQQKLNQLNNLTAASSPIEENTAQNNANLTDYDQFKISMI